MCVFVCVVVVFVGGMICGACVLSCALASDENTKHMKTIAVFFDRIV